MGRGPEEEAAPSTAEDNREREGVGCVCDLENNSQYAY